MSGKEGDQKSRGKLESEQRRQHSDYNWRSNSKMRQISKSNFDRLRSSKS